MSTSLKNGFGEMISGLSERFSPPPIQNVYFPPFHRGGQPKDAQFMAIRLEGGATGISYVLLPDDREKEYNALFQTDFSGKNPGVSALKFGSSNPVLQMLAMATTNAICQHVMKQTSFPVDSATDSLELLSISPGDRLGMVGLFSGLIKTIEQAGAELVVIEKNERLIRKFPDLHITPDPAELKTCNKILSTSTVVLNESLDGILSHKSPDAFVAVVGPTAGYFPDPLFARGVDVVGGRIVNNGELFFRLLAERRRWGDATRRTCFRRDTYESVI
jgi:hypothetical protein